MRLQAQRTLAWQSQLLSAMEPSCAKRFPAIRSLRVVRQSTLDRSGIERRVRARDKRMHVMILREGGERSGGGGRVRFEGEGDGKVALEGLEEGGERLLGQVAVTEVEELQAVLECRQCLAQRCQPALPQVASR